MDFFKIVSTKEKKGVYFSVVPHRWEKDACLYWPEHLTHPQREALRSNSASIPAVDWVQYPCILKYSNINSFKDALQIERQLADCVDTEAEEMLFINKSKKREGSRNKPTVTGQLIDRNDLFSEVQSSNENINILQQIVKSPLPEPKISKENVLDVENVSINSIHQSNHTLSDIVFLGNDMIAGGSILNESQIILPNTEVSQMKEDIASIKIEICTIKREMKEQYAKLNVSLDKIYKLLSYGDRGVVAANEKPSADFLKKFNFPLSTCEQIASLDAEIRKNAEFKLQIITVLSKIGGTSGGEDGGKIAYKVIDYVFSPDVLINYSWTEITRPNLGDKDKPIQILERDKKKPFQILEGILAVFFEVLFLADNRHTRQKNANIFKDGVLKHAKKRSARKRLRPSDHNKNSEGQASEDDSNVKVTADVNIENQETDEKDDAIEVVESSNDA